MTAYVPLAFSAPWLKNDTRHVRLLFAAAPCCHPPLTFFCMPAHVHLGQQHARHESMWRQSEACVSPSLRESWQPCCLWIWYNHVTSWQIFFFFFLEQSKVIIYILMSGQIFIHCNFTAGKLESWDRILIIPGQKKTFDGEKVLLLTVLHRHISAAFFPQKHSSRNKSPLNNRHLGIFLSKTISKHSIGHDVAWPDTSLQDISEPAPCWL